MRVAAGSCLPVHRRTVVQCLFWVGQHRFSQVVCADDVGGQPQWRERSEDVQVGDLSQFFVSKSRSCHPVNLSQAQRQGRETDFVRRQKGRAHPCTAGRGDSAPHSGGGGAIGQRRDANVDLGLGWGIEIFKSALRKSKHFEMWFLYSSLEKNGLLLVKIEDASHSQHFQAAPCDRPVPHKERH